MKSLNILFQNNGFLNVRGHSVNSPEDKSSTEPEANKDFPQMQSRDM